MSVFIINACATKLKLSEVPHKSKVLIIANTSDDYTLHYSGFKIFPIQRNDGDFKVDLSIDFKLSDIFVETIVSKENESKFTFIRPTHNNIRPF